MVFSVAFGKRPNPGAALGSAIGAAAASAAAAPPAPAPKLGPGQNLITPRRGKGVLKQPGQGGTGRIPGCARCNQQIRCDLSCMIVD